MQATHVACHADEYGLALVIEVIYCLTSSRLGLFDNLESFRPWSMFGRLSYMKI
jgi:hypothetical protein